MKILFALCAIGIGVYWGLQPISTVAQQFSSSGDWLIPKAYQIKTISMKASKVKGYKLWLEKKKRKVNKKNNNTQSPVQWSFLGSVKVSTYRLALIKLGETVKRFSIGDSLPDGSVIKEILIDTLVVTTKEGDLNHLLFH